MLKNSLLFTTFFLIGTAKTYAQIPVIDATSIKQQIEQVAAWGKQISAMKDQLTQAQKLHDALNGTRGIGMLLNDPTLKNALPANWQQVYSAIQSNGYKGLTGSAKAIRDSNMIYNCEGQTGAAYALCQRDLNQSAQDEAYAQEAYMAAQKRLDNIQNLMGQINSATDAKTIADLQARMQAEQAMIQNEQTKLQMFKMIADAKRAQIDQQKREADVAAIMRTGRAATKLQVHEF